MISSKKGVRKLYGNNDVRCNNDNGRSNALNEQPEMKGSDVKGVR